MSNCAWKSGQIVHENVYLYNFTWKSHKALCTCKILHEKVYKAIAVCTCQNPCVLVKCCMKNCTFRILARKSVLVKILVYLSIVCMKKSQGCSLVYLSKSLCTCKILHEKVYLSIFAWKSVQCYNIVYLLFFAWKSHKAIVLCTGQIWREQVYMSNCAWKSVHVKLCMKKFTC